MNITDGISNLELESNISDISDSTKLFGGNLAGTISNFFEQNKPLVIGGILVGAFIFLSGYGKGVTNKIKKIKSDIKKKL